jgi:hypothetical protein
VKDNVRPGYGGVVFIKDFNGRLRRHMHGDIVNGPFARNDFNRQTARRRGQLCPQYCDKRKRD